MYLVHLFKYRLRSLLLTLPILHHSLLVNSLLFVLVLLHCPFSSVTWPLWHSPHLTCWDYWFLALLYLCPMNLAWQDHSVWAFFIFLKISTYPKALGKRYLLIHETALHTALCICHHLILTLWPVEHSLWPVVGFCTTCLPEQTFCPHAEKVNLVWSCLEHPWLISFDLVSGAKWWSNFGVNPTICSITRSINVSVQGTLGGQP